MKIPVRRRIAVAALLIAAPAATACSQGFDAQTDQQYQPSHGVNDHLEGVDLLNVVVVAGGDQRGTLAATIVADEDVALTEVSGSGITVKGVPVQAEAGTALNLGGEGGVEVSGTEVEPGGYVELSFTFGNGETSELNVPVVAQSGDYADVQLPAGSTPAPEEHGDTGTHEESTEDSEEPAH